jgi:hypothetical protein
MKRALGGGPGRNDLDDVAFDNAFGGLRVLGLFADGDFVPGLDETVGVTVERVERETGERRVFGRAVVSACQCQAEHLRRYARVVVEHFVEVAHAIEQNGARIARLDFAVLTHERRKVAF